MKTLHRLLKEYLLLQRFQIYVVMLLMMFSLTSCFQKYYKTNTVSITDSATLRKLIDEKKSFIIHCPEGLVAVKNARVGLDVFSGEKGALNPVTEKYMNSVANSPNRLHMKQSGVVLNEVHLYTNISFQAGEKLDLNINQIYRIDVNEFDKKATRESRTLSIIGIGLGSAAIVGGVALAAYSMDHMFDGMTLNLH